jgi:PEP-CTERM motif
MKISFRFLSVILLLVLAAGAADASGMLGLDWLAYGGSADVTARFNGSEIYTPYISVGVGSFEGVYTENGVSENTGALFCLDLFHTFSGTPASWEVTRTIIPPNPQNPPPWNTHEAVWAYHRFNDLGWSLDGTKAAGLQLALWEISHDQDWRTKYGQSVNWYSANASGSSDFSITQANSTVLNYATSVLDDVYSASMSSVQHAYYYDPAPLGGDDLEYSGKQGFVGKSPEVPEPSTVLLLGLGIVVATGATWRRRART